MPPDPPRPSAPLLALAVTDRNLPSSAVRVLAFLAPRLDAETTRPVKVWGVATALGMDRRTVSSALDVLTARGYLVEDERDGLMRSCRLAVRRAA